MTEIKRDPFSDLPSTGCQRCDADSRRRQYVQALRNLEASDRIVSTGERPCLKCGKPLKVYVASKFLTRHWEVPHDAESCILAVAT
jgi:hypothetical protein